jgi:hypothetical protein
MSCFLPRSTTLPFTGRSLPRAHAFGDGFEPDFGALDLEI